MSIQALSIGVKSMVPKALGRQFRLVLCLCIIACAIILTLFQHYELSHETWGYWAFARIFSETGRFIILDRSPLYILYLQPFRLLSYPVNIIAEYIVTTIFFCTVLLIFLRPYIGYLISTYAIILWLPYLQISEPPVQKLALAAICIALVLRKGDSHNRWYGLSYLFAGAAWLLRSSFVVYIVLFLLWDCVAIIVRLRKRMRVPHIHAIVLKGWPIGIFVLFVFIVYHFQSPHPWNNVWFATTSWFPSDGKTLSRSLQVFNDTYIWQTFGTFEGHDFYATNKEAFRGAKDIRSAIRANPHFFQRAIPQNFSDGITMAIGLTRIPSILRSVVNTLPAKVLVFLSLFFGVLAWWKDKSVIMYFLGAILMSIITFTLNPSFRYFVYMFPVFIISSVGYTKVLLGNQVYASRGSSHLFLFLGRVTIASGIMWILYRYVSGRVQEETVLQVGIFVVVFGLLIFIFVRPLLRRVPSPSLLFVNQGVTFLFTLVIIFIFSSGPTAEARDNDFAYNWPVLIKTLHDDIVNNDLKVLDTRDTYFLSPRILPVLPLLTGYAPACRGIMSLEYTLLAAFSDIPIEKIYDVWEIPPFDHYNSSSYHGLTQDRINCLFISKKLLYGVGGSTNTQIRYLEYIMPYGEYLISLGARRDRIEGYGEVIVLK